MDVIHRTLDRCHLTTPDLWTLVMKYTRAGGCARPMPMVGPTAYCALILFAIISILVSFGDN